MHPLEASQRALDTAQQIAEAIGPSAAAGKLMAAIIVMLLQSGRTAEQAITSLSTLLAEVQEPRTLN